ncbi:MAG: hypothetical protein ACI9U2_001795 [Bradymonadia bacterium]|jgi:hypothetical protein
MRALFVSLVCLSASIAHADVVEVGADDSVFGGVLSAGVGQVKGAGPLAGMSRSVNFAMRSRLQKVSIDVGFRALIVADEPGGSGGGLRGVALVHLNDSDTAAFYLGGGVGLGLTSVIGGEQDNVDGPGEAMTRIGLGAEFPVVAGVTFSRTSVFQPFLQAEANLPAYDVAVRGDAATKVWAPTFTLALGLAVGP